MDSIKAEGASKFGRWAPRPAGDVYARARRLFDFDFKGFVFDPKSPNLILILILIGIRAEKPSENAPPEKSAADENWAPAKFQM